MTNIFLKEVIKKLNRDQADDNAQMERYEALIYQLKINMKGREEVLFVLENKQMIDKINTSKASDEFKKGFQRGLETILTLIKHRTYSIDELMQLLEKHIILSEDVKGSEHD